MLQYYGSWKRFQIVLLLILQVFLMHCHVIYSTGLTLASLNTSIYWDSVLSLPCPISGLCRGTGIFSLPPQARLKLQQWDPAQAPKWRWWGMCCCIWRMTCRDLGACSGWHCLCKNIVPSSPLCTSPDYSCSVSHIWKSPPEWRKVFKRE